MTRGSLNIQRYDNRCNVRARPLIEMVNEQFAHLNDGRRSKGLTALLNFMDTGNVLGNQMGDADVYEFADDSDYEGYEDGEDYGAPETRRKRSNEDTDREMMRQARQGKILVFSDEEDEGDEFGAASSGRDPNSQGDNGVTPFLTGLGIAALFVLCLFLTKGSLVCIFIGR